MLQAFIDDSGIGQAPVYCLTGFVAEQEVWNAFSEDWRDVLKQDQPIAYFKLKEALEGEEEFQAIPEFFRNHKTVLINRVLEKYIDEHGLRFIHCQMLHKHWLSVEEWAKGRPIPTHYQFMSTMLLANLVNYYADRGYDGKIEVILDRQQDQEKRILNGWSDFADKADRIDRPLFAGPPRFGDDKIDIPIQAADYLALYFRKTCIAGLNGSDVPPFPWKLKNPEEHGGYMGHIDGEMLRQMMRRFTIIGDYIYPWSSE